MWWFVLGSPRVASHADSESLKPTAKVTKSKYRQQIIGIHSPFGKERAERMVTVMMARLQDQEQNQHPQRNLEQDNLLCMILCMRLALSKVLWQHKHMVSNTPWPDEDFTYLTYMLSGSQSSGHYSKSTTF